MKLPHLYTDKRVWYSHEKWITRKFGEIWIRLWRVEPPGPRSHQEIARVLHLSWIRL